MRNFKYIGDKELTITNNKLSGSPYHFVPNEHTKIEEHDAEWMMEGNESIFIDEGFVPSDTSERKTRKK